MKTPRCPQCHSDGVFKKFESLNGNLYECWICEQKFIVTDEQDLIMIPTIYTLKEATTH